MNGPSTRIIAIAAMSPDRVIGGQGTIPWHLPGDLQFFKRTTLGHVVLMGRKTFDSLRKPLPGRENWVVSRTATPAGVRVWRNPEDVAPPDDGRTLFVIGGAAIYEAFLPRCGEILLTHVHRQVSGDTWFPPFESAFDTGEIIESHPDYEIRRHRRIVP